jgi:hypothetical protein
MAEDDKKPEEESTDETRDDEKDGAPADTSSDAGSGEKPSSASTDAAADEDDEDEEEEEDDEDEEEASEEPAAAAEEKPKPKAKSEPPKAEPVKAAKAKAAREPEPAHTTSPRKRAPLPPEPPPAALGKTVTIFVVAMAGLSAGFYLLGAETGGGDRTAPRWKTGQTVDVNITLVATDRTDLACASDVVIADRRCEFVNKTKPAEKTEDAKLLKPYSTTDNVRFLGAGLWSQPDLEVKKLPADRFTVKCKFTVEGEIKKPGVRWNTRGGFSEREDVWYAGALKECSLAP